MGIIRNRLRVLVFLDYYLPGYRGGGPLRTISAMANRLANEFEFLVVASDRDVGDNAPYASITPACWTTVEHASVYYLRPQDRHLGNLRKLISSTPHDIIYLNSLFSFDFSIKILLLRRLGLIDASPVILAPRGELGAGSFGNRRKKYKKLIFSRMARILRLFDGVTWHGSSDQELAEIRRQFGKVRVHVAPNLADQVVDTNIRQAKRKGAARILFLSRITSKKNLHGAIAILRQVRGEVDFVVCGTLEDPRYWQSCLTLATTLPPNIRFRYIGAVPHKEVPALLGRHDLLFLPTLHENFGHVILEALTVGTPVLISDTTPWSGLEFQQAGWDLSLHDESSFVEVIEQVVEQDETEFGAWSDGARAMARRLFASDEAAEQNRHLLRSASA